MGSACRCGCDDPRGAEVHRIVAALALDDVDSAIEAGLLASEGCAACSPACMTLLVTARDARRAALAARERFRRREARLLRRQQERTANRAPSTSATPSSSTASLPPAAAEALRRALGKAAGRGPT
jgi:hypothetical protein